MKKHPMYVGGTADILIAVPEVGLVRKLFKPEYSGQGRHKKEHKYLTKFFSKGISVPQPGEYGVYYGRDYVNMERIVKPRPIGFRSSVFEHYAMAAEELGKIHELRLVYRDVKPDNFLTSLQEDLMVVDLDYVVGIGYKNPYDGVFGTPWYMSPEQVRNDPLEPTTDVFSLALSLYRHLTGELPKAPKKILGKFTESIILGESEERPPSRNSSEVDEILRKRLTETFKPLEEYNDVEISHERSLVIMKGLNLDPSKRHQDGHEFAEALARAA